MEQVVPDHFCPLDQLQIRYYIPQINLCKARFGTQRVTHIEMVSDTLSATWVSHPMIELRI